MAKVWGNRLSIFKVFDWKTHKKCDLLRLRSISNALSILILFFLHSIYHTIVHAQIHEFEPILLTSFLYNFFFAFIFENTKEQTISLDSYILEMKRRVFNKIVFFFVGEKNIENRAHLKRLLNSWIVVYRHLMNKNIKEIALLHFQKKQQNKNSCY